MTLYIREVKFDLKQNKKKMLSSSVVVVNLFMLGLDVKARNEYFISINMEVAFRKGILPLWFDLRSSCTT